MAHHITDECIACGSCQNECPEQAISDSGEKYDIDSAKCTDCGTCAGICPVGACVPGV